MEQNKNSQEHSIEAPGPERTIGQRLEWAREHRNIERAELIKAVIGWPRRSAYSNIVNRNLPRSKYYAPLCRKLQINQVWLMTGNGEWDASNETDAGTDPWRINENLLMLCHQAAESFSGQHVAEADITRLELFAMTARLYEEAVKIDPSLHTEENLKRLLFQHYVRAMQFHKS